MQKNLLSEDNTDWQTYISMRKRSMQVNLLNGVDDRKRQPNVSMKKKQVNLSNVHNIDRQINISMRKKKLQMNLLKCRQQRLQTHKEYKNIYFFNGLIMLIKSKNFMLLFLEVHCTFLLVVTNCGKNTVLRCSNSVQFKLTSFQTQFC